jgi:hypothetical protein
MAAARFGAIDWIRDGLPGAQFNVCGRSACIEGVIGSGTNRVRVGGIVLTDFTSPVRSAEQTRLSPLLMERRTDTGSETISVAHDRPVITAFWDGMQDGSVHFGLESAAVILCSPVRLELSCGERGVLIVQVDSPVAWDIQDHHVGMEWTGPSLQLTLAATGIDRDQQRRVEAALREPVIVERAGAAALGRLGADGLVIESSEDVLDSSLLLARARVSFAAAAPNNPRDGGRCVLGALAGGDTQVASAWLDALLNTASGADQDAEGAAWCALAAARHFAWTGDVAAFATAWPLVSSLVDRIVAADALSAAALREAALAAESMGERERAALWRSSISARVKVVDPLFDAPEGHRLRELSTLPLTDPAAAGQYVAMVVSGLLGAEPDASRHRLRLRPNVPDDLLPFHARGFRMGEAVFRLDARGSPALLQLEIEQVEGPVPVTLILEPFVAAREIGAVRIDDHPAQLQLRPQGEGWVVPVQITLDHARRMDIERKSR